MLVINLLLPSRSLPRARPGVPLRRRVIRHLQPSLLAAFTPGRYTTVRIRSFPALATQPRAQLAPRRVRKMGPQRLAARRARLPLEHAFRLRRCSKTDRGEFLKAQASSPAPYFSFGLSRNLISSISVSPLSGALPANFILGKLLIKF